MIFFGSATANFAVCTGSQALGELYSKLDSRRRQCAIQRLQVRIGSDELHTVAVRRNHVIDGIATRTSHPNNFHLDFTAQLIVHEVNAILFHTYPPLYVRNSLNQSCMRW